MARRKSVNGKCHLCGAIGKLSYEHVPPKKAYNEGDYYIIEQDDLWESWDVDTAKKIKKQGGIGFNTLCVRCNNNTGSWYGREFVSWSRQAMGLLYKANKKPTLFYPQYIFPLRVIKQIITMFFSVNTDFFQELYPELQRFVLNKEEKYLDKKYKVYGYYNIEGNPRYMGYTAVGDVTSSEIIHMSEIAYPPFGYVLTMNSKTPDSRLVDITDFSHYSYNEWLDVNVKFPVLPTHIQMSPADYRSKDEIMQAIAESAKYKSA